MCDSGVTGISRLRAVVFEGTFDDAVSFAPGNSKFWGEPRR
jgi:hypothetical protein